MKDMNWTIELLPMPMSICRLHAPDAALSTRAFCFSAVTDAESSLVCPTECAPANAQKREDGYRMMRVCGVLDFSLIGILARICAALAQAEVGVFCISTYDTDYVLVRQAHVQRAVQALSDAGYTISKG